MSDEERDVNRLIDQLGAGEVGTEGLMGVLYTELHAMARRLMGGERGDHTLQPTALVHEAFLRLMGSENVDEMGRLRFLAAGAVVMRRVLIDHARSRSAEKRGAGWSRITLQGLSVEGAAEEEIDLVQLNVALEKLEALDPRQAKVVELKFFSGMTGHEIGDHLGLSRNTIVNELTLARAWLQRELSRGQ